MRSGYRVALYGLVLSLSAVMISQASVQSTTSKQLRVLFIDSKDHSLNDIRAEDIELFEAGVKKEVTLKRESLPARYAFLIDNSGSLRSNFPNVLGAAQSIVNNNQDGDETALVSFVDSSNIRPVQLFTSEKSEVLTALRSLKIEGGHTAITNAVYTTVEFVKQRAEEEKSGRRNNAVVLISDGENREDQHSPEKLYNFLRTQDVRIYSIGLVSELDSEGGLGRKAPRKKAEQLLQLLAKNSGGRAFFVTDPNSFVAAVTEITHDLHNDYLVAYESITPGDSIVEIKVTKSADNKKRTAIVQPGSVKVGGG